MDRTEFWALIERSLAGNEHDCDAQAMTLVSLLSELPRDQIQSFAARFSEQEHRADRWDVRGAGYILQQGMGDDSFDYFKSWLVGRGERVFELALANPDALADEPSICCEAQSGEILGYAALDAYRAKFGTEMPDSYHEEAVYDQHDEHGSSPRGRRWQDEELADLFPRLWAKCGSN